MKYNHLTVEYFVHDYYLIAEICRCPEVGEGKGIVCNRCNANPYRSFYIARTVHRYVGTL